MCRRKGAKPAGTQVDAFVSRVIRRADSTTIPAELYMIARRHREKNPPEAEMSSVFLLQKKQSSKNTLFRLLS